MTAHGAKRRGEKTAALVGMRFSRLKNRFFTNNAFSLYNFGVVKRIFYFPEPGSELNRIIALIFDRDTITEGKMDLVVLVERAFEVGFHRNFYASCYLLCHLRKLQTKQRLKLPPQQ